MDLIKNVEIRHFRSIYDLELNEASDVNVISGINDVGKSNIIKALNLFFNFHVDWRSSVDIERDTNNFHTFFSKNARKKKLISVKVTFRRPSIYRNSELPNCFWVKRQWDRENPIEPKTTWGDAGKSVHREDRQKALTWFLKKCRFYYVPAIRDRNYLLYLLGQFSEEITESPDEELKAAGDDLIRVIQSHSSELRKILKDVTGLEFTFELPESMLALLRAAGLYTENNIPFQLRGDGIQGLTVPGILQYLNIKAKNDYHIWGFEEPENSLEYKKATTIADSIRDTYSKSAQIFLTTHSPAFLAMENTKTTIFRVTKREQVYERLGYQELVTDIQPVFVRGNFSENLLPRELGILEIARKFDRENRDVEKLEKRVNSLEEKIAIHSSPVLLVEGKNDKATMEYAWKQLFSGRMPFKIIDSGGVNEVTELAKRWDKINENKFCALFDHDKAGTSQVGKLGNNKAAMILPPPAKEGGQDQADNLNLSLEFYFPDQVLRDVNKRSGGKLFCENRYVDNGEHKRNNEDFLHITSSNMKYRLLKKEGKSYLVDQLNTLTIEDFRHFELLFEKIVSCIAPDFELKMKEIKQGNLELQ